MESAERDGKILLISAVVSALAWLLLSGGYNGEYGPITNFYYTMHVVNVQLDFSIGDEKPFCHDEDRYSSLGGLSFSTKETKCASFTIMTKHLMLLSLLVGTYGFLIWKSLLASPFPKLAALIRRMRGPGKPN